MFVVTDNYREPESDSIKYHRAGTTVLGGWNEEFFPHDAAEVDAAHVLSQSSRLAHDGRGAAPPYRDESDQGHGLHGGTASSVSAGGAVGAARSKCVIRNNPNLGDGGLCDVNHALMSTDCTTVPDLCADVMSPEPFLLSSTVAHAASISDTSTSLAVESETTAAPVMDSLHYALSMGSHSSGVDDRARNIVIARLLSRDANPNATDGLGVAPLALAIAQRLPISEYHNR